MVPGFRPDQEWVFSGGALDGSALPRRGTPLNVVTRRDLVPEKRHGLARPLDCTKVKETFTL